MNHYLLVFMVVNSGAGYWDKASEEVMKDCEMQKAGNTESAGAGSLPR